MSVKGFPSNQKLPLGTGITNEFVTVQPINKYRNALEITKSAFRVGGVKTAAASTGNIDGVSWIYDTATVAKVGDFIRFETGSNQHLEVPIVKVEANRFLLGALLSPAPIAGDTFYIMRYVTPKLDADGALSVTASSGPVEFVLDSVNTQVERDTVTPANSVPLPVIMLDSSGNPVSPGGDATLAEQQVQSGILQDISDQQLGVLNSGNSSVTPLGIGGVFTGVAVDIKDFSAICVAAATDQSSATNGLSMQFSPDGTNWDHKHEFTIAAPGVSWTQAAELRYFRIVYTNGAVAQTYFRLTTILKRQQTSPSRYTVEQPLFGGQMADINKSVIFGKTTAGGGSYVDVKVNPSGALTVEATLSGIDASLDGQKTMAASFPVVIASDQSAIPVTATTLPLPTGAATDDPEGSVTGGTAGTKSYLSGAVYSSTPPTLTNGQQVALQVDASGNLKVASSSSGALDYGVSSAASRTAAQIGNASGAADFGAGATTAQTVRTVLASDQVPTSLAQAWNQKITDGTNGPVAVKGTSTAAVASDPALVVTMSPNSVALPQSGRNKVQQLFNDYSVTSVTTAAYTQLTASSTAAVNKIEIFDSSGEALILAVGGAGSEVDQLYIFPGGNGAVDLAIPASSRISVKAKTATASAGFLAINLYS